MSTPIYVTGHINPDMDCTVASFCYAYLKNKLHPEQNYVPIRCGALNDQTKNAFKQAGQQPPELVKNIYASVGDVVKTEFIPLAPDTPILDAARIFYTENISLLPVLREEEYQGAVSVNEVSSYLVSQSGRGRPIHEFWIDNLPKVIPGIFLSKGKEKSFKAPIMTGAMPYDVYLTRMQDVGLKPILVVGNREKILSHAIENQLPAIVITGLDDPSQLAVDVSAYEGTVFLSNADTAESVRLLRMSVPVYTIANTSIPKIQQDMDFEEAKHLLMDSEYRGLPVFDEERFIGIVTRRSFLEKPSKKLIMVDHNEIHQSITGADQAQIVEIIDHHRFAAAKTTTPIYIASKPVGSSSTIVYQHFKMHGVYLPPHIALLLFSGIISDTVNMKSPTATREDEAALRELSVVTGLNPDEYAMEMFSQLQALHQRDPRDVIGADFKTYSQFGWSVGIGQVEVINLEGVQDLTKSFDKALESLAEEKSLDWAMLLITDVMKQNSLLVSHGPKVLEEKLVYQELGSGVFNLPQILSRKKQVLPEILRVLEDSSK
jgi:manganese-dependent inorganic pyrophosphatase